MLNANNQYIFGSSPGLVANVQQWVNNPGSNFGLLIRGDESVTGTAMRYDSRASAALGPLLSVDFTAVPEPSSMILLAMAAGGSYVARRRRNVN